jgi:hypothetical protein
VAITVAKGNSTRRVQRPQTQTHNSCFGPNQEENTSCCSPSSGRPLSAPLLSDGTYTTYTTTRLFPINPSPPIKQEEKRKHIINEVIETERAYVSFLSLLVQVHFSLLLLLRVPSLCATLILRRSIFVFVLFLVFLFYLIFIYLFSLSLSGASEPVLSCCSCETTAHSQCAVLFTPALPLTPHRWLVGHAHRPTPNR